MFVIEAPAGDPPRMVEFIKDGVNVSLLWSSREDRLYQLQRSTDYKKWLNFGEQVRGEIFTTQAQFLKAASDIGPRAGYRIVEVPVP